MIPLLRFEVSVRAIRLNRGGYAPGRYGAYYGHSEGTRVFLIVTPGDQYVVRHYSHQGPLIKRLVMQAADNRRIQSFDVR